MGVGGERKGGEREGRGRGGEREGMGRIACCKSGTLPRYLIAAFVMIDSSKLEVPPRLFTTSATFIPAIQRRRTE